MSAENCENCRFFKSDVPGWSESGYCCRYPPIPVFCECDGNESNACWPGVGCEDWCGEFKPKAISQEIPANAVDQEELGLGSCFKCNSSFCLVDMCCEIYAHPDKRLCCDCCRCSQIDNCEIIEARGESS